MKRFLRSALLVVSSFCVTGFAAAPPHREKQSDAEIEAAIRAKLAKSKIGKDGFTVHVHNGIATWQGSTKIMQHKGSATRMAKTAGATQVVNNIKISEDAREAAAANLGGQPKRAVVKQN
jgi:hypothetical protein